MLKQKQKSSRRKSVLSIACATFAVAAVTLTTGMGCNRTRNDGASVQEAEKIMIPVKAAAAQNRDVMQTLSFSGSLDAVRHVAVTPALQGARVLRIFVDEGENVREGQLLARMEDFQLRQSAAQLAQLEADLRRAVLGANIVTPAKIHARKPSAQSFSRAF